MTEDEKDRVAHDLGLMDRVRGFVTQYGADERVYRQCTTAFYVALESFGFGRQAGLRFVRRLRKPLRLTPYEVHELRAVARRAARNDPVLPFGGSR